MSSRDETSILDETFAPSASVPPHIALQLRVMMERINDLEATNAALEDRLATLEGSHDPGDTGQDAVLREEVVRLQVALQEERDARRRAVQDLEELNELRALEIAQDRRRIAALEVPEVPPPTTKTLDHLDTLDSVMKESRIRQTSFTNAARLLGLSSSRIRQLKPLITEDRRFAIVKDPHHRQRLLIRTNFRM